MSDFFTRVEIPKTDFSIDYHLNLLFMGSCFSDSIGRRMQNLKFKACHNPFGVVYNPVSISNSLTLLVQKERFGKEDLSFYNELWFSYSHNTLFSDTDQKACLDKINKSFKEAKKFIYDANVLIITLGTSWVYQLKETGKVVANCHKIPSENFNRSFSSVENTCQNLQKAIDELRKVNPEVKIVFTVSPIRHWKDGAIGNQRSKAALILAISKLQEQTNDVYYFPAYEIFMDELRDYRFYAEDMLHPSDSGTEYIWDRFSQTFLSKDTIELLPKMQSILNRMSHRPVHKKTNAYKQFISSLREDMFTIQNTHPYIDFKEELQTIDKSV